MNPDLRVHAGGGGGGGLEVENKDTVYRVQVLVSSFA